MSAEVIDEEFPDMFEVINKKPGFKYRLINKNSRNISAKLRKGYQIVQGNDPEKLTMSESTPMKKGGDLDTTRGVSDVILARIPEEKFAKLTARNQALIKRQAHMIVKDFDQETGPLGFNPNRDPTGHATRYHAGVTQTSFDKSELEDKAFEAKYGMPKGEVGE